jgi:VanZ family protein
MGVENIQRMASEPWRNPRPAPNLNEARNRVPPQSVIPAWLRAWWPALLWSTLIFFASTDSLSSEHTSRYFVPLMHWLFPVLSMDTVDFVHHIFRKCAHFVEYFIFFLLVYRGIRAGRREFHWSWGLLAWFIAAVYSLSDEFHQALVESRGASIWDSFLDSGAALVALIAVYLAYRYVRRSRWSE